MSLLTLNSSLASALAGVAAKAKESLAVMKKSKQTKSAMTKVGDVGILSEEVLRKQAPLTLVKDNAGKVHLLPALRAVHKTGTGDSAVLSLMVKLTGDGRDGMITVEKFKEEYKEALWGIVSAGAAKGARTS